ncbi:GIY-YIG nuclease family protein [Altererythrobacter aurantiacus]|uniref:GIY-YIG nuclease family protein n=1 Tax=Parapontixanthobacter aurantiacus TaxID=1463599 RepID=A0A844ZHR5_9SPHN|nr:GIY-YIG nuclease family protein [Parapontixanthobacter aurantiacus]MXO87104.1 GIY-YIG nuclease family protein [Parapontixanthobacter aurantiacus]
MADLSDDELLAELGVEVEQQNARTYTPREERIIAGFEDIVRFVEENGRAPQHGEDRDIFERLYAVRLDRLRALEECCELLSGIDKYGLLAGTPEDAAYADEMDDDSLFAELGIEPSAEDDIRVLRHVPTAEERRAAEEVAHREKCEDFEKFKPLFEQVKEELNSGIRETRPFELKAEIRTGAYFIVGGQIAYVAKMGDVFTTAHGRSDARLRVIFDNGTQSNMLMRSLQRALNGDEAGRRITDPQAGPLFSGRAEEGDMASGTIYVLRSKSDHHVVAQHRDIVHKIGVTNMAVEKRIAGAHLQPTFLMANVEIVAQYTLYNINRTKLEKLIHRVFGTAQLDIEVPDRFGTLIKPREWFLVPLNVIDEAVRRIRDKSIENYRYDPQQARLVRR